MHVRKLRLKTTRAEYWLDTIWTTSHLKIMVMENLSRISSHMFSFSLSLSDFLSLFSL